ncbi:actin-related protein 2/3 complex subunit 2B-like isoform X2 [Papaver somniferum]|uniref:actin-related protein 2/3 complex subunit 2B-like isoform X2 n=1 Tax=Papaver somniferum TaxID=3469 RepID=UPI000E6F84EA|nr:actin-related protein 2/3 complex subunit 2B-like isoform X2 [Papaver somniferum]
MKTKRETGCFDRASPALKEILLKFYYSHEKQSVTDYQLIEFGSVQYHVQVYSQDSHYIYLSVSSPLLTQGTFLSHGLSKCISQRSYSNVMQVAETPKAGYPLTIRIDLSKFIEMLCVTSFKNTSQGMYNKPIKVVLDAKDHFFVITQPEKTAVVFPMRFGDDSDVIIATTLFQELVVLGSSKSCAKAPSCTWSPIPPAELRGEYFEDLTTNGGFMSFDVLSRHIKRSRIDKTVWNLSNFQAYVRHYVKCTRGFVQRSMRKRVERLSEMLLNPASAKQHESSSMKNQGHRRMKIFGRLSKAKLLRKKCSGFLKKIMQLRSKIKIHGLDQIRRRWLKFSECYSSRSYTRLD